MNAKVPKTFLVREAEHSHNQRSIIRSPYNNSIICGSFGRRNLALAAPVALERYTPGESIGSILQP